ncbi:DAD family-domain-containing protein [Polychytrium aggregatum]|uniref:DAD family-domain-containing protein n=1 Tax=Polychytrium aggregatum TaxID=110093 RepID=UPI0022FEAFE7|nr:DAD family-domain-containing protein [Polychytrium aggregatum]KAI9197339.1 DAD family-domain-containing protein [Polychytrium aggregatum]
MAKKDASKNAQKQASSASISAEEIKAAAASPAAPASSAKPPAASPAPSRKQPAQLSTASLLKLLVQNYWNNTPQRLKLIDSFLVFVMITGIVQFVYMLIAGSYPYNAFLSGFISSVGVFILAANLRIQTNPESTEYSNQHHEKAFAEFLLSGIVLFGFVINFIG